MSMEVITTAACCIVSLLTCHLVLFRGWLCHLLLITLRLVICLARLLETKLGYLTAV